MFKKAVNIDTAFRYVRFFTLITILASLLTCSLCIYKSYSLVEKAQNKVHILYNGKVLEAIASDKKTNLPVELRDHIRTFHQYFFNFGPDEKAIQANVTKALYLADESAKRQYDNLRESGYFNNLISANISQETEVDSIRLNVNGYPYSFICYATEKLVRASSTVTRRLVTQGEVRDIKTQTDNNPHGFLIQHWEILENRDVKVETH